MHRRRTLRDRHGAPSFGRRTPRFNFVGLREEIRDMERMIAIATQPPQIKDDATKSSVVVPMKRMAPDCKNG